MKIALALVSLLLLAGCATNRGSRSMIVEKSEFIYQRAPFPSCHASTIVDTKSGLVAAWFGGSDEGENDVGIWVSRHEDGKWSWPVEAASGVEGNKRYPCWNPVLFQPRGGPLILFYKVGPSPSTWWGMMKESTDGGVTWSRAKRLPNNILGPIKNKPVMIGDQLWCPSSTEHDGWRIHMEYTDDLGKTWTRTEALSEGREFGAIQPTVLPWSRKRVQLLCRAKEGRRVVECWSEDGGKTFSRLQQTTLANPNSGLDAVMLKDGRALLVYNDTPRGRTPLTVAVSNDGQNWTNVVTLESEPGEYSYPAIIQGNDGKVHITYTWKRQRIKHVVLNP